MAHADGTQDEEPQPRGNVLVLVRHTVLDVEVRPHVLAQRVEDVLVELGQYRVVRRLSDDAILEGRFEPKGLDGSGERGGIVVIEGDAALVETEDWEGILYRTTPAQSRPYTLVAIPYYAWDHREAGEMRVWISSK